MQKRIWDEVINLLGFNNTKKPFIEVEIADNGTQK